MHILVTAGPTREPIDPVRFLSNRSSGKMGYAIARAAAEGGHTVQLISGPVTLAPPRGVKITRVETAEQMLGAVRAHLGRCDVLVMAAAVADWRPRTCSKKKLKKATTAPRLDLERTPDILAAIRPDKGNRILMGFAAETHAMLAEARRKLTTKGLDVIVANDVSQADAGFEVDTNRVTLLAAGRKPEPWPLMSKDKVAKRLVRWLEARWAEKIASTTGPTRGTRQPT